MNNRSWGARIFRSLIFSLLAFGISIRILISLDRVRSDPPGSMGPSCHRYLKQLGLAMQQYGQDYGAYPLVKGSGRGSGWAESLSSSYVRTTEVFQCPEQGNDSSSVSPKAAGYTDYWIDARLSGCSLTKIAQPGLQFLMGDGNDGSDLTNARYAISDLPSQWINDTHSPLYHHEGKFHMLFADGHVKRVLASQVTQGSAGTF